MVKQKFITNTPGLTNFCFTIGAHSSNFFQCCSITNRSEERRVGKECRSLCDWSSDVCSSDLDGEAEVHHQHARADELLLHHRGALEQFLPVLLDYQQIGRASCRERV